MKHFLSILVLFFVACSQVSASDYFDSEIIGADPEIFILEQISLDSFAFKDSREMKRYNNTLTFIIAIKTEAKKRFQNGSIPLYRRYDVITNLDTFAYTMNQYFIYQMKYEQTKKSVYRDSARSYLQDSKGAYDRLKSALKKSTN